MKTYLLEVAGVEPAFRAMRLPYEGESKGREKDLRLASGLTSKGDSHAKFARLIDVWLEIDAPRYWWQEFDTYRIGVEKVSSSTMHLLGKRHLEPADFQGEAVPVDWIWFLNDIMDTASDLYYLKALLPESFIQKRIIKASYQALHSMYRDRKNHRLAEWQQFFHDLKSFHLPYDLELIFEEERE